MTVSAAVVLCAANQRSIIMPKTTKKTAKKRTQVRNLPKSEEKLNKKKMSKVKGGMGPEKLSIKSISG